MVKFLCYIWLLLLSAFVTLLWGKSENLGCLPHLLCVDGLIIALQDLFPPLLSFHLFHACWSGAAMSAVCQMKDESYNIWGENSGYSSFFKVGGVFYSKWFLT